MYNSDSSSASEDLKGSGRSRKEYILTSHNNLKTTSTRTRGAASRFMNMLHNSHGLSKAKMAVCQILSDGSLGKCYKYSGKIVTHTPPRLIRKGASEIEVSTSSIVKPIGGPKRRLTEKQRLYFSKKKSKKGMGESEGGACSSCASPKRKIGEKINSDKSNYLF